MNYYMARYSDNYADEIDVDVDGLCFITQEEKDLFFESLEKIDFTNVGFPIGTNLEIYYEKERDVLRAITFESISYEDYLKFKKIIGAVGVAKKFINFIEDLAILQEKEEEDMEE